MGPGEEGRGADVCGIGGGGVGKGVLGKIKRGTLRRIRRAKCLSAHRFWARRSVSTRTCEGDDPGTVVV